MKVKDLIAELSQQDQESDVLMVSPNGPGYAPLSKVRGVFAYAISHANTKRLAFTKPDMDSVPAVVFFTED